MFETLYLAIATSDRLRIKTTMLSSGSCITYYYVRIREIGEGENFDVSTKFVANVDPFGKCLLIFWNNFSTGWKLTSLWLDKFW